MSEPLGLDSITFDTFGWEEVQSDETMRAWQGDGAVLVENFFPLPPDIESLDPDAIRVQYENQPDRADVRRGGFLRRIARRADERTRQIIEVTVERAGPVPIVRSTFRLPLPDRYLYSASLLLPLARCSWVVQVQSPEVDLTGLRESVAMLQFLQESQVADDRPSETDPMAGFEPYDARWDGLVDDPLSAVRRQIGLVERSLVFAPAVLEAPPYR